MFSNQTKPYIIDIGLDFYMVIPYISKGLSKERRYFRDEHFSSYKYEICPDTLQVGHSLTEYSRE